MASEINEFDPSATPEPAPPARADENARRRGQRVLLALVLIWVVNGFDLAFTIMANNLGSFNEGNPIARVMLNHPYAIYTFKLGLVGFASVVLITFRRLAAVEVGTWALLGVYVALSVIWLHYFQHAPTV